MPNYKIIWSSIAIQDLKNIKNNISKNRLIEIVNSPKKIIFSEQYQIDEYREDCRRILVGNYKILYQSKDNRIDIIRIFNSKHNPINSK
jgi:mRNA-degrading endonuclease RelE of RelBE toxin-antitoxin system